jgi:hypothetical protein
MISKSSSMSFGINPLSEKEKRKIANPGMLIFSVSCRTSEVGQTRNIRSARLSTIKSKVEGSIKLKAHFLILNLERHGNFSLSVFVDFKEGEGEYLKEKCRDFSVIIATLI